MNKNIYVSINWDEEDIHYVSGYQYDDDGKERTIPEQYIAKLNDYIGDFVIDDGDKKNETLEQFRNQDYPSILRNKILDSEVTIVLLTPNQKNASDFDMNQWLPYEIQYSLNSDNGRLPNGIIYVILPNKNGDVEYAYGYENKVENLGLYDTKFDYFYFHDIVVANTYNKVNKSEGPGHDNTHDSYIAIYDWDEFLRRFDFIIEAAKEKRENAFRYKIETSIKAKGMFNDIKK